MNPTHSNSCKQKNALGFYSKSYSMSSLFVEKQNLSSADRDQSKPYNHPRVIQNFRGHGEGGK